MNNDEFNRRLLSLEAQSAAIYTRVASAENEVQSLRQSRHDYGAKLQVHELEIQLLKQSFTDGHGARIEKLEGIVDDHVTLIADLRSDVKLLVWRVGMVTSAASAVIFTALNYGLKMLAGH